MNKLTPEEQSALVAQAQNGNKKAQAALLAFCERDILAIVSKMRCSAEAREDLAQVGRLAILESAIPNFKADKGLQFRFYAAQWVRTEVRRSNNTNSSVVTINVRTAGYDVSLDAPVGDDDSVSMGDTLESEEPSVEDLVSAQEDSERVRKAMEHIISRLHVNASAKYDKRALCRDLVYNRILSDNPVGLEAIANRFGVVRETVRKDERYLLSRLAVALGGV